MARVAYYIQYTIVPSGGTFLSLKLDGCQVVKYVGPDGAVAIEDLYEIDEDAYVASDDQGFADEERAGELPGEEENTNAESGKDF